MMKNFDTLFRVGTVLVLLLSLSASADKPVAAAAGKESRGARALKASFYLNTVPTMVEMVGEMRTPLLDALELDAKSRAIVEKAMQEIWTEAHIYSYAAAALEKRLPAKVLDAALKEMTPDVQATIKAGISEGGTPEQTQAWLVAARKHPDAKEREALARRIVLHMPQSGPFKELLGQVPEAIGDIALAATGTDELRAEVTTSMMASFDPMILAMSNRETMVIATVVSNRDQPTSKLKALADALDSDHGKKLQEAAAESLVVGTKKARKDLLDRIQKDLGRAKKK